MVVQQPYARYTEADHAAWHALYSRLQPRWVKYANPAFQEGRRLLRLDTGHIPRLENVNRFLAPLTGFRATPVGGYVPSFVFFDCLRRRQFPTTVTIRKLDQLDYLPEPDIFHDVAGHVPMHTNKAFAETLVRFGECARTAAGLADEISRPDEQMHVLSSMIRAMARFFWFTIEFGLMRCNGYLKAYGSGLLSSFGELEHSVESNEVQRYPLQLEWVVNQQFEINHFQPLLFTVDSFEHLYALVGQLDEWLRHGKLNHVAPGEPTVNEGDLRSFLNAAA